MREILRDLEAVVTVDGVGATMDAGAVGAAAVVVTKRRQMVDPPLRYFDCVLRWRTWGLWLVRVGAGDVRGRQQYFDGKCWSG